ncbi:MAG: histidine phosphatase family protein [Alphaproteobacteria bacterium]|nr:histidine phosphatase family protein [Alphaproteobacteria bacterium]
MIFRNPEEGADKNAQAKKISTFLKKNPIDVLFSSDMKESKELSESIKESIEVSLVFTSRLRDINLGKAKGVSAKKREKNFPEVVAKWPQRFEEENKKVKFPEGESYAEFKNRIFDFLYFILKNRKEENIAISTHGDVMAVVLGELEKMRVKKFQNTEIMELAYEEDKLRFVKRIES